jgi:tetratricopeptide (TPR) repeat protein
MKFLVALSLAAAMFWSVQGAYGAAGDGGTTTYRNTGTATGAPGARGHGSGGVTVIGSDGTVTGTGGIGVGTSVPGVGTGVIEDDPQALHEAYKKRAENDYTDAAKALAAGDMETAVRLFIRVVEMSKMHIDSPYPQRAYEQLGAIVEQAQKELEVARQLLAGEDPAAGLLELKRIARVYMGLNPAKAAATLGRQLEVDPAFQATLRAGRLKVDLQRAAALETEAESLGQPPAADTAPSAAPSAAPATSTGSGQATVPAAGAVTVRPKVMTEAERAAARLDRLTEAYEIYGRVAQLGGDTDVGKQAAAARTRLEADAGLMARIQALQVERKARQYLSLADGYFKSNRFDLARQYCMKIIEECPKTPQAADAKALMEHLLPPATRLGEK